MSSNNKITLKSSDGETFEVDYEVAMQALTIKKAIEDVDPADVIPLPKVTSNILSKVLEYCGKHASADDGEELKAWDAEFAEVDQSTLFDLTLAAKDLEIKGLLDLTCQTVDDRLKGKTPEEIRKFFNIKNDFTPEEEEEIRRENPWAFE